MIDKYFMYIIASIFFVIGIAAGALYGIKFEKTGMDIALSIVAGGFAGSAVGGIIFTYLYMTGQNDYEDMVTTEHGKHEDEHEKHAAIDRYEQNKDKKALNRDIPPIQPPTPQNNVLPIAFKGALKKDSLKKLPIIRCMLNINLKKRKNKGQETDKQKIKRLKKEIKQLKKNKKL